MKKIIVLDWQKKDVNSLSNNFDDDYLLWNCKRFFSKRKFTFIRYFEYSYAVLYILLNSKKFKNIIIWQQMIGYILALLPVKKTLQKTIITTVLYSPKNTSGFRRFLFTNALKKSKALVYFSKEMSKDTKDTYKSLSHKVYSTYIPIIESNRTKIETNKFDKLIDPEKTIFCGGQSDRDFETVIETFSNTEIPVIIVCPDNYPIKNINSKTDNIKILRFSEVSADEYYEIVSKCFCVIIPLKSENSSCGQLLFSFCMKNEKPIIASDSFGVRDYITNDFSGILVPVGNTKEIYSAYVRLKNDSSLKDTIIQNAKYTASKMTFENYLETIDEIIENENPPHNK